MRQSSEKFMEKMLELNSSGGAPEADLSTQIGEMIDKKMEEAMSKFTAEMEKVNKPSEETQEVPQSKPENLDQEKGEDNNEEGNEE